jgi:hypothetical protein
MKTMKTYMQAGTIVGSSPVGRASLFEVRWPENKNIGLGGKEPYFFLEKGLIPVHATAAVYNRSIISATSFGTLLGYWYRAEVPSLGVVVMWGVITLLMFVNENFFKNQGQPNE